MFKHILKQSPQSEAPLEVSTPLCHSCLWFHRDNGTTCDAFPAGIPVEITLGAYDHHHWYEKDGLSDDGLVYTPDTA